MKGILIVVGIVIGTLTSPDPVLFLFAAVMAVVIVRFFWRENEPQVLLISLLLYWSVVSILLLYGWVGQQPLNDLTRYGKVNMERAMLSGLFALGVYGLGIHLFTTRIQSIDRSKLTSILLGYDMKRLLFTYVIFSVITGYFQNKFIFLSGGQLIITLFSFKWVLLMFLVIRARLVNEYRWILALIISAEILLSFAGYWAAFKDYVLVLLAGLLFFIPRVSLRTAGLSIIMGAVVFSIAVVWSYSKTEYRAYLTEGERTQVVVREDQSENLERFWQIASRDFSSDQFAISFSKGVENLFFRVSYIEFLALAQHQVPVFLPHENGRLLMQALEHVFKPRILFPDKKPIYDSELTSKYTGVRFAGAEQGTSFSLGTVAESYVDFGSIYMFVPLLLFGCWIGWLYRNFIVKGYSIVWGMCLTAPLFQFSWSFPVPTSKLLGWSIMYFIVYTLVNRYGLRYIDNWLQKSKS